MRRAVAFASRPRRSRRRTHSATRHLSPARKEPNRFPLATTVRWRQRPVWVRRARVRARTEIFHAGSRPASASATRFSARAPPEPGRAAARARPPRPAKRSFTRTAPSSPARSAAARKNARPRATSRCVRPTTRCFVVFFSASLPEARREAVARGNAVFGPNASPRTPLPRAAPRAPPRARPPRAPRAIAPRAIAPRRRREMRARPRRFRTSVFPPPRTRPGGGDIPPNPPVITGSRPKRIFPVPAGCPGWPFPPAAPPRPPLTPHPIPPPHRTRPAPRCPSPQVQADEDRLISTEVAPWSKTAASATAPSLPVEPPSAGTR